MQLSSRHLLALGGVGLALGGTGVAVAQSGSGATPKDRATRPGGIVRPDRQAFLDDVAKRAGVDPAKLRDAIRNLRPGGGPGLRLGGPIGGLGAAADYLGLQPRDLFEELQTKTLAQVAAERGKSVDGLEQALRDAARTALDQARSSGRMTQQQEDAALKRLDDGLDDLVNGRSPQVSALAKALGIDRQQLVDAIRDAKLAEVDKALADKRIDQQQADRLKQRIRGGEEGLLGFGFGAPIARGHGAGPGRGGCDDGPRGPRDRGQRPRSGAAPAPGTQQRARPSAFFS